jgi:hypothetical protein
MDIKALVFLKVSELLNHGPLTHLLENTPELIARLRMMLRRVGILNMPAHSKVGGVTSRTFVLLEVPKLRIVIINHGLVYYWCWRCGNLMLLLLRMKLRSVGIVQVSIRSRMSVLNTRVLVFLEVAGLRTVISDHTMVLLWWWVRVETLRWSIRIAKLIVESIIRRFLAIVTLYQTRRRCQSNRRTLVIVRTVQWNQTGMGRRRTLVVVGRVHNNNTMIREMLWVMPAWNRLMLWDIGALSPSPSPSSSSSSSSSSPSVERDSLGVLMLWWHDE